MLLHGKLSCLVLTKLSTESKLMGDYIDFALLCCYSLYFCLFVSRNSHHLRNQSDGKLKLSLNILLTRVFPCSRPMGCVLSSIKLSLILVYHQPF